MKTLNGLFALICAVAFAEVTGAVDVYLWQGTAGDGDLANKANWTLNGSVPETFPPALDTATSGSTHPVFQFDRGGTLALPTQDTLTLQDMVFLGPDTSWTIDLGSREKTLALFGYANAALWLGGNLPDGQRVTVKSGLITRAADAQRNRILRLGAGYTNGTKPSSVTFDGAEAVLSNLVVQVDSPNAVFCLTNGACAFMNESHAFRLNNRTSGGGIRISGEGTVVSQSNAGHNTFLFGDAAPTADEAAGILEITDGARVTNANACIGRRGGNFTMRMDRGAFSGGSITLAEMASSTNNALLVQNASRLALNNTLFLGLEGGRNRAVVADSTLTAGTVALGRKGLGHNALLVTNGVLQCAVELGGNAGVAAAASDGNVARFVDTTLGTADAPSVTFQIGDSCQGLPSSSNRVELVRSTWPNRATYLGIGGWGGGAVGRNGNAMVVDDHSTVSCLGADGIVVGGFGFGNRLEVKDGSRLDAHGVLLGRTAKEHDLIGTNVLFVGKGATIDIRTILQLCPGGNEVIVESGSLTANYLRLHYFYSEAQQKAVDGLEAAEGEYGRLAKEIWGSRFVFRGGRPIMRVPNDANGTGSWTACLFDRSCRVEFELPACAYEQAVLQSSVGVRFEEGVAYRFDLSHVSRERGRQDYPLASAGASGTLELKGRAFEEMATALAVASGREGLRAKLHLSADGKTLLVRVTPRRGLAVILR